MAKELSAEDQQELDDLKQVIEQAVTSGVLTQAERDAINTIMKANGQVTFEDLLDLVHQLISGQVTAEELKLERPSEVE